MSLLDWNRINPLVVFGIKPRKSALRRDASALYQRYYLTSGRWDK